LKDGVVDGREPRALAERGLGRRRRAREAHRENRATASERGHGLIVEPSAER
jgi:hypothetical protein